MQIVTKLLNAGIASLIDYLLKHTLTCLIPAFFIAGAISSFVSKESVLRYFGKDSNRIIAYLVASVSGTILAVCSCTVLPLFAGIYRLGAGFGPAITFLYSGPAINVLAMVYSARLLGIDLGLARIISAILLSIIIGISMETLFSSKDNAVKNPLILSAQEKNDKNREDRIKATFIALLVLILLTLTSKLSLFLRLSLFAVEAISVVYIALRLFKKEETLFWLTETFRLFKLITPLLLIGVFFAGVIKQAAPPNLIANFVGENSLTANLAASMFGALMYFATLTEVPIVKALMELGMNKGPVLSLLLSGPALSLPSILALIRIIGVKKTFAYLFLVVVLSATTGHLFGFI